MLPSSLSSYAPIIRGVANTNAKVTITQGGYKIYETTVHQVPSRLMTSASGFGSELLVTIEEADGSKRTFTQPILLSRADCNVQALAVGIFRSAR